MEGRMMRAGLEWLANKLGKSDSTQITYRRGDLSTSVKATLGRTLLKLSDPYGNVQMVWTDRDFILRQEDLVLDGAAVVPERGDLIEMTVRGSLQIFEVLVPSESEQHYKADPHDVFFRVHTKRVQ